MNLFFEEPARDFQLRELSRLTKIAVTSVKKQLVTLQRDNLIKKDTKKTYPTYTANQQNRTFKLLKQQFILLKLYSSGLINYLEDELHPRCIILFGSIRKGEYDKNSDIDIFVQTPEKKINLSKFEKKLEHNINLFFEDNIKKISNELFNNIVNGILLSGYLKLK